MLGDSVEKALSLLGINKEGVELWLGKPCQCKERQDKLNAIQSWAIRVIRGKTQNAKKFLSNL